MSDSTIQIPPDSTGKMLDTEQVVVGANTTQRQRIVLAGALAAAIAQVKNTDPDGSEYALLVRVVGGGGSTPTLAAVLTLSNDAGALTITNLADPAADQDAATKNYVDTQPAPTLNDVLTSDSDANGNDIRNAGNICARTIKEHTNTNTILDIEDRSLYDHNDTPVFHFATQAAAIDDPTGGAIIDAECRTQLAALLATLRNYYLIAS